MKINKKELLAMFAKRLKYTRIKNKFSQSTLAMETGSNQGLISSYEKEIRFPDVENLLRLCSVLRKTPNYFLGYEDDDTN